MTCSKPHENSVFKEEARVSMLLIGFRAEKTPMDLATWKMEMAVTKTSGESCASWELGISSRGVSGRQSSQVQLSNCCGQDSILQTGTCIGLTEGFVTRVIQSQQVWMRPWFLYLLPGDADTADPQGLTANSESTGLI